MNVPRFSSAFTTAVKIIPGGSPVVQSIGQDVSKLAMPIRCTASELGALYGDVDGDTHTLSWSGGSDTALLESVSSVIEIKPGVDMFYATLNFIRS